jgi:cytochrome c peroxidase
VKKCSVLTAAASVAGVIMLTSLALVQAQNAPSRLSPMEELGKRLFFDRNLSSPAGQDCAACHGPSVGFTGPLEHINKTGGVYEGAVKGRFGNRKPPSAAYAGDSPKLHLSADGEFVGGMFGDGRATGDVLGDPLAEQAMGPFLNPLEQNMPDARALVLAVGRSEYVGLFEQVFGPGSLDADKDPQGTSAKIGRAIAAYERSTEVNPFSSKFDDFWRAVSGKGLKVETIDGSNLEKFRDLGLAGNELRGLALFNSKGMCASCHVLTPANGRPPVFADYKYDNLGIPRNPENPFYGQDKRFNPDGKNWVDPGLGGFLQTVEKYRTYAAGTYGRHRTPTLRNVDKRPSPGFVKAFMHNGYFKSLKDVVHFYNTRDVSGAGWPPPEVAANLNTTEMGDLGLTDDEEDAIVDFMRTLTDRR